MAPVVHPVQRPSLVSALRPGGHPAAPVASGIFGSRPIHVKRSETRLLFAIDAYARKRRSGDHRGPVASSTLWIRGRKGPLHVWWLNGRTVLAIYISKLDRYSPTVYPCVLCEA